MMTGKVIFERGPVVKVEIAETDEEKRQGLKNRTHLSEDEGMLFLLGYRWRHGFWMKETRIPLDLIFFDHDRVAGQLTMQPLDEHVRKIDRPSTSALEVPGGWALRHGIQDGDRVQFVTK